MRIGQIVIDEQYRRQHRCFPGVRYRFRQNEAEISRCDAQAQRAVQSEMTGNGRTGLIKGCHGSGAGYPRANALCQRYDSFCGIAAFKIIPS